jgi:hypothetical protein
MMVNALLYPVLADFERVTPQDDGVPEYQRKRMTAANTIISRAVIAISR